MATIRILGPIDVVAERGTVAISGRHERMLLGGLAVTANRAVRFDDLAQILWRDDPPHSRDNALQTCVSRLRGVVGHDRITAEDHSYVLHATASDLDSLAFEELVAQAVFLRKDPEHCLEVCKTAIELWRGVPFGDFADEDPFRLEVIRLDELRLCAIELRIESEIALHNEELVVGTLEGLDRQYPYRERIWRLLITALALDGRRVEALRACHELRSVLGDVGLDPTSEIEALEDAILANQPDLRLSLGPGVHT
jgi:DNA-binding SARP family transcriptional activator